MLLHPFDELRGTIRRHSIERPAKSEVVTIYSRGIFRRGEAAKYGDDLDQDGETRRYDRYRRR
jgi:hypothetical protein